MPEIEKKRDFRAFINPNSLYFNNTLVVLLSATILTSFFLISQHRRSVREKVKFTLIDRKEVLQGTLQQLQKDLLVARKHADLYNTDGKEIDRFRTFDAIRLVDVDLFRIQKLVDDQWRGARELPEIGNAILDCETALISAVSADGKLPEFIIDPVSSDTMQFQSSVLAEGIGLDGSAVRKETLEGAVANADQVLTNFSAALLEEHDQALRDTSDLPVLTLFLIHLIFFLAVITILGFRMSRQIGRSVDQSGEVLKRIASGDIGIRMEGLGSEFRAVEEGSNQLIGYLQNAGEFARKIGEGDFDYDFKPRSDEDALGNALVDMRVRLNEVARADRIRNWSNEGQAKFADILRLYDDDIYQLGDQLISNLVEYMGASQGTIFILNEEESDEPYLEMLSTYAFNRKKFRQKHIALGEGLIGQTFIEKKKVYMTDIRSNHFDIQSGLGESKPSSILIVPLKEDQDVEGIIEIASFNELKEYEIAFVERIAQSVASSIRSSKVNRTTKRLLQETQEKAEEMKAQEEELRQNMEELAATQEQMQRKNQEMEEMQESLSREKYLLEALLNNTRDAIYFKDKDSKFIRLSQSLVERFGAGSPEEVIGKSDFDFQGEEHAREAFEDEQRIINTGVPVLDIVEKEKWPDGRITWVSTSKNPLTDHHGNIIGTFGISRDVTDAKRTELEVKKQAKWMFNYFENSDDELYLVLDQDGKVNFSSPDILRLLGAEGNKDLAYSDVFIEPSFKVFLSTIQFKKHTVAKQEMVLLINNGQGTSRKFIIFAGSEVNEDGTRNIFMIGA